MRNKAFMVLVALQCATLAFGQATAGSSTVTAITCVATGSTALDNALVQSAADKAAKTGYPLVLDATQKSFRLSTTIYFKPPSGLTQAWIRATAYNNGRPTVIYSGSGSVFNIAGIKNSYFGNFRVNLESAGSSGFLVTTYGDFQSTSNIEFDHVDVGTYASGTFGWHIGPTGSGGADISNLVWRSSTVTGDSVHFAGVGGYGVTGGNTLNLAWYNCNVAYQKGPAWSFWADTNYTPSDGGGDNSSLFNCGGSYLDQVIRVAGGYLVNVQGGRDEVCGVSGGGVFETGSGGGTNAGLIVTGHHSDAIVSGASFAKGGNQTKVFASKCVAAGVLVDGYYLNGSTLTPSTD